MSAIPDSAVLAPVPALTHAQRLIAGGMMAALALAALDATVVGTALPTIAGQLGGLSMLGWTPALTRRPLRPVPSSSCA